MVRLNFSYYEKVSTSITLSEPFLRSLLPPNTKILGPIISFRVKTTENENPYDLYSKTCVYRS